MIDPIKFHVRTYSSYGEFDDFNESDGHGTEGMTGRYLWSQQLNHVLIPSYTGMRQKTDYVQKYQTLSKGGWYKTHW